MKQSTKSTGGEVDQLAVDEKGRLVLLELKDGLKRDKDRFTTLRSNFCNMFGSGTMPLRKCQAYGKIYVR